MKPGVFAFYVVSFYVLRPIFWLLLSSKKTRVWAYEKLERWSLKEGVRNYISYHLQPVVSAKTGWPICKYCQWAVDPKDPHEFCDKSLAQEASNKEWEEDWAARVEIDEEDGGYPEDYDTQPVNVVQ